MKKFLLILSLSIVSNSANAEENSVPVRSQSYASINCEGAPAGAIQKIEGPAAPYALIFCAPQGHAVAAVDGFVWLPADKPSRPFLFSAAVTKPVAHTHDAFFTNQRSRKLEGTALESTNKMLEAGYQITEKFSDVVQLDIKSSTGPIYTIFFFVNAGRPIYVLGCLDRCNTSALLREYSLEDAKAVMR